MEAIWPTILLLGIMGLLFGAGLAYASRVLAVRKDERIEAITALLPGANCGACGYPGCSGYASAIVEAGAPVNACCPGGAEVSKQIAAIMGVEPADYVAKVARVMCQGDQKTCGERFHYEGVADCEAAHLVGGGFKACTYGCLGLGNCAQACPFGAITMQEGLPVIKHELCGGCGKCVAACPRKIIELVDVGKQVHVRCRSKQKGAEVRKICKLGCIGCGLCVKACPVAAISVQDNLAQINYALCTNCGACAAKCPTKAITVEETGAKAQAAGA